MSNDQNEHDYQKYRLQQGNPYASLGYIDDGDDWGIGKLSLSTAPWANKLNGTHEIGLKAFGDPYRNIETEQQLATDIAPAAQSPKTVTPQIRRESTNKPTLSKKAFMDESRLILQMYVPKLEGSRLRPQHQDFIQRNAERLPEERYEVLQRLRRYDLRSSALVGQFNREDPDITAQKLAEVENLDKPIGE